MRSEWRENDLFVAYARGELEGEAAFEFEERLASDAEFARKYEEFLELDLIADLAAMADRHKDTRRNGGLLLFAIAAIIVVTTSIWWLSR